MDNLQDDFNEEIAPPAELTISQLNDLCLQFKSLKDSKKELEDQVKEFEALIGVVQSKILAQLEANNMTQHRGEFGLIHVTKRAQVAQPETMQDKAQFFDYLRERGIFMDLVSVNSNTLKSWVNEQMENQAQAGNFTFSIPGLKPPTSYKTIGLRK